MCVCVCARRKTRTLSLLIQPLLIVCEFGRVPVVSSPQTAGEGDEPLDWLYQTPADGAAETEQISQVCSSAGVRDIF